MTMWHRIISVYKHYSQINNVIEGRGLVGEEGGHQDLSNLNHESYTGLGQCCICSFGT